MIAAGRIIGQALLYVALIALIAYGTNRSFTHFAAEKALIKLSFTHGAARASACRRLSSEELAQLPPNMRRAVECERGRLPVVVEMTLDGATLLSEALPPTGLSSDGPSRICRSFAVEPGLHRLVLNLRDTARASGFDYTREADVQLAP